MKDHKNNKDRVENIHQEKKTDSSNKWVFEIDGCMRDIRKEPREFQEQAYYCGMIPFIPADYPKNGKSKEEFKNNIRIVEIPSNKNKSMESETVSE